MKVRKAASFLIWLSDKDAANHCVHQPVEEDFWESRKCDGGAVRLERWKWSAKKSKQATEGN
jgi:hypothetical protein